MNLNSRTRRRALPFLGIGLLFATTGALGDVITLQMTGIPGDTKFAANNGLPSDSIRVLTVGNGVELAGCTVGGLLCTGRVGLSNLSIVKKFGESSPALFTAAVTGRYNPEAWVRFYRIRQGVPVMYFQIRLTEVVIASQKWIGNSGAADSADTEAVEIVYSRIEMTDIDTGAKACYDAKRGTLC